MAARPIDDTAKNLVAVEAVGSTYTAATTQQKAQIDEAARTAANRVNAYAQFFALADRTADAGGDTVATADAYQIDIAEWFNWWLAEAGYQLAFAYRKEAIELQRRRADDARKECLEAWTSQQIATTNLAGGTFTLLTIRQYILGHCVRRKEPLYPDVQTVDNSIQEVLNELWNSAGWTFRRRTATMRIGVTELSTATWTESSKTLTQTGAFASYTFQSGDIVRIESGTGAVPGDYRVASRTSDDAIVLVDSLSAAAGNLSTGDIAGALQTVRFFGLDGATFDAPSSRKWWFQDGSASSVDINSKLYGARELCMEWLDADQMASVRGVTSAATGRPEFFRMQSNAGTRNWRFWPRPDQAYTLFGEVFTTGPTLPTTPSGTTAFDLFPAEFRPVIRQWALARVLANHGVPQNEDRLKAMLDPLLASYDDHGNADNDQSIRDVNGDYGATMQFGGWGWAGV